MKGFFDISNDKLCLFNIIPIRRVKKNEICCYYRQSPNEKKIKTQ